MSNRQTSNPRYHCTNKGGEKNSRLFAHVIRSGKDTVLTASKNKDRCKCVVYGPVLSYYGGKRVVLMLLSNRIGHPVSKSSGSVHFLGKRDQSPLSLN